LINLSLAVHGTHELNFYSIQFFGQFIQYLQKIVQKTQIRSRDSSDRSGILSYLQRKLSLSEFHSFVLVSASSTGDSIDNPSENVLMYEDDNQYRENSPNQSI
jgi:hypothetical protein